MSKSKITTSSNSKRKTNIWDSIKYIGIASINKGQFLPFIVGLIIIVYLFLCPSEVIGKMGLEVLSMVKDFSIVGYLLFLFTLIISNINTKRLRKNHFEEITRISIEKKELQELLISKNLITSK